MSKARKTPPSTKLDTLRWDVPGLGRVRLNFASKATLSTVDREWPKERRGDDEDWRWVEIARTAREVFCLASEGGTVVALWASRERVPIELAGGAAYRLDCFEVGTAFRATTRASVFAIALVALRAHEVGAKRIVLGAVSRPNVTGFYEKTGAIEGPIKGWKVRPDLLPFEYTAKATKELREIADLDLLQE